MKSPRNNFEQRATKHFLGFGIFLIGIALFFTLAAGIAYIIGQAHSEDGRTYRIIGVIMVTTVVVVLVTTVRRWAKWLPAICIVIALKALLALLVGTPISAPHLKTNYPLVIEMLLLYVTLVILTVRYADKSPKSTLEVIAAVGAVVGLAGEMVTEPNLWPLVVAVVLVGISWLADRLSNRRNLDIMPKNP